MGKKEGEKLRTAGEAERGMERQEGGPEAQHASLEVWSQASLVFF